MPLLRQCQLMCDFPPGPPVAGKTQGWLADLGLTWVAWGRSVQHLDAGAQEHHQRQRERWVHLGKLERLAVFAVP